MRLGTSFVPFLRPRPTSVPRLAHALEPACHGPAPDEDAVAWTAKRTAQRRAEWQQVVARIEALAREFPHDDARVARAYADVERRGVLARALASPGMSAEGLALWWLRVGRNGTTRPRRPVPPSPPGRPPSGAVPA